MIYDSAAPSSSLRQRDLWQYRGLIGLLITRDVTVRYKRSVLGVWWTLLNPLLTTAVMLAVFSQVFRFATPDVPYVVYLLSGVIVAAFFSQGIIATSRAIVERAPVLTKLYVPAEAFALAAGAAAGFNFLLSTLALTVVQLITGAGIPWTLPLILLPTLCLLMTVTGLGLLIATGAIVFYDVLDLTALLTQLVIYLTPVFYPIEIVPDRYLFIVQANPLYSYLLVFRGFAYEATFAPWWAFAVMVGTALVSFAGGVWLFGRKWNDLVALL